ncbi:hypothetical protein Q3G72_010251 [Acer saccharum]|nr:hypothetical protein Q3G72_010251 [Acer saccharum]
MTREVSQVIRINNEPQNSTTQPLATNQESLETYQEFTINAKKKNSHEDDGNVKQKQMSQEDVVNTKKKQGLTKLGMIQSGDKCLSVTSNERGQSVSKNSKKFSSYLGVIVREHVPIGLEDWPSVDSDRKDELWTLILQRFEIAECYKEIGIRMMGKMWRQFKSLITKRIIKANRKTDRRLTLSSIKPNNITSDKKWESFIKNRLSSEFKKEESLDSSSITRVDVWIRGHKNKDGKHLNEATSSTLKSVEERKSSDSQDNLMEVHLQKILD